MIDTVATAIRHITPSDDAEKWDAYVDSHPKGTIFHRSGMLRAFDRTPKHRSLAIAAVGGDGEIVALLSSVNVATLQGIGRHLASRSIWYAEPLCDPDPQGAEALASLIAVHDRAARACLFTEVRPIAEPGSEQRELQRAGYEFRDYLNYIVDTTSSTDILMGRLSKSTRNKIRRSHKRGVEIHLDNSHDGVERMYRLVQESYARSRVPLASVELFHATLDELGESIVQIRIATHEGKDIAGGIGLVHAGRFYAWYGGSLRTAGIVAFDCLTWDEICWASDNGQLCYDFGGAGWPEEEYGPREFKKKFGGDLVRFGRYVRVHSRLKLRLAESAYKIMRGIITK